MTRARSLLLVASLALGLGLAFKLSRRFEAPEPPARPTAASPKEMTSPASPTYGDTRVQGSRPTAPGVSSVVLEAAPPRDAVVIAKAPRGLRERDGVYHYNSDRYGASLSSDRVSVASARVDRGFLSYQLEEVRVASEVIAVAKDVAPTRSGDAVVSYARARVEERYTLRADALEQDFIFRELPEGRGAITVTGRVRTNLAPPSEGTKGPRLSFTRAGQEELFIEQAVAVDADGRRLPLELAYADGKVSVSIPAGWVADAALPITLDPIIGSPVLVDAAAAIRDEWQRYSNDVAYNSTNNEWLATWAEAIGTSTDYKVYGQRVSSTGTLVGSLLSIGNVGFSNINPSVCYAPSVNRYLVSWTVGNAIKGRVVNGDGTFFTGEFTIDDRANQDDFSDIAFDGANWYVSFSTWTGSGWFVVGRFVSTAGVPGASADPGVGQNSSVAFTNGVYLIVWQEQGTDQYFVHGRVMNPAGTFQTPMMPIWPGGMSSFSPQVSAGSGKFLITWLPAASAMRGRVVNTSLGFETDVFSVADGSLQPRLQEAAYSSVSGKWLFTYWTLSTSDSEIHARQIDPFGNMTAPEAITTNTVANWSPALAWNSSTNEMLVTYFEGDAKPFTLLGQRYSMPGAPSPAPPAPTGLTAVAGINQASLSWNASAGAESYILRRGSTSGGPYTVLASGIPSTSYVDSTALDGNTYYYVVTATNGGGQSPFSNQASATLAPPPPPPPGLITLDTSVYTTNEYSPQSIDVEYNSTNSEWLVVWVEAPILNGNHKVYGQRVSAGGTLVGGALSIGTTSISNTNPALCYAPSVNRYLVSWTADTAIKGRVVNGDGSFFTGEFILDDRANQDDYSDIAFDGTNWYVSFSNWTGSHWNVVGRFVSTAGAPGAAADPGTGGGQEQMSSVAFTNGVYLVAWQEQGNPYTLHGRTLNASGTFLTPPTLIWQPPSDAVYHVNVSAGAGKFLVTWATNIWSMGGRIVNTSLGFDTSDFIVGDNALQPRSPQAAYSSTSGKWLVTHTVQLSPQDSEIYVREVDALGTMNTAAAFTVNNVANWAPNLAWNSSTNEMLIAYFEGNNKPFSLLALRRPMSAVPPPPPPATPTGLAAVAGNNQSTLSWNASAGATTYTLKRRPTPTGSYSTVASNIASTSWVDTTAANGGTYYYVVTASNTGGESPNSNEASVTLKPSAPAGLSAVAGNNQATLSWGASSGATSYTLKRGTTATGPYPTVFSGITSTSYVDTSAQNGFVYFYVVTASNAGGESSPSNEAAATLKLPAPTGVSASASDGSVTVTWTAVTAATRYDVWRSMTSGGTYTLAGSSTTTSFTDSVQNEITYYYVVSAWNSATGSSAYSAQISAQPTWVPRVALFVVGNPTLSAADERVRAQLTAIGYSVQIVDDSASDPSLAPGKKLIVVSSTVSPTLVASDYRSTSVPVLLWEHNLYDDMGMTGTSASLHGVQNNQSSVTIVTPSHPMAAGLSGPVAVTTASRILTWGKPNANAVSIARVASDSTRIVIFGYEAGVMMAGSIPAPGRRVGFLLEDLTANALNANGESLLAAAARWASGAPLSATTATATYSNGSLLITWSALPGITSFRIKRSTSPTGPFDIIASGITGTSFVDTSAVPGQVYYYIVEAVNAGGVGPGSAVAIATPPPSGLAVPRVTTPSAGSTVTTNMPTVGGTSSAAGLNIDVYVDGVFVLKTVSGTGGAWSLQLTAPLVDGPHAVFAVARSATDVSPRSAIVLFVVDTPAAPVGSVSLVGTAPGLVRERATGTLYTATVSSGSAYFFELEVLLNGVEKHRYSTYVVTTGPTSDAAALIPGMAGWGLRAGDTLTFRGWVMVPGVGAGFHDRVVGVTASSGDQVAPVATLLAPAHNSETSNPRPRLSAGVTDSGGSGVSGGSVKLVVNGRVVSGVSVVLTGTDAAVTYDPLINLSEGWNSYEVYAEDQAGIGAVSPLWSFMVDSTSQVLPTPQLLLAQGLDSRVSLTWTAVTAADYYLISRSLAAGGSAEDYVSAPGTLTTFEDIGLNNGTTYFYRVQARALIGSSAFSGELSATPGAVSTFAALLVVGASPLSEGDAAIQTSLEALQYVVTTVLDGQATAAMANQKSLVVISSSTNSALLGTTFDTVATPLLVLDDEAMVPLRMVAASDHGILANQSMLDISDATHPMAAERSGTVSILTSPRTVTWGIGLSDAQVVAYVSGSTTQALIFGYEKGAALLTGTAPGRRTGCFLHENAASRLSADGMALFQAALRWTAGTRPAPGALFVSRDENGRPVLRWLDTAEGQGSYVLRRSTSPGGPYQLVVSGLSGAGFVDLSAPLGVTLYYTIQTLSAGGISALTVAEPLVPPSSTLADLNVFGRPILRAGQNLVGSPTTWNRGRYYINPTFSGVGADVQVGSGALTAESLANITKFQNPPPPAPPILSPSDVEKTFVVEYPFPATVEKRPGRVGPFFSWFGRQAVGGTAIAVGPSRFEIGCQDRITLAIQFRFPEVVDGATNTQIPNLRFQDPDEPDIWNANDLGKRMAARLRVALKYFESLSKTFQNPGWKEPHWNGTQRDAWDQGNIDFYMEQLDLTMGNGKNGKEYIFEKSFVPARGQLALPVVVIDNPDSPSPTSPLGIALRLAEDKNAIQVVFVSRIEGAGGLTLDVPTKDDFLGEVDPTKHVIFIASDCNPKIKGVALAHEIGHVLLSKSVHTQDYRTAKVPIEKNAIINNPRSLVVQFPVNQRPAEIDRHNLMCEGNQMLDVPSTLLTDEQCWKAYTVAKKHRARKLRNGGEFWPD